MSYRGRRGSQGTQEGEAYVGNGLKAGAWWDDFLLRGVIVLGEVRRLALRHHFPNRLLKKTE